MVAYSTNDLSFTNKTTFWKTTEQKISQLDWSSRAFARMVARLDTSGDSVSGLYVTVGMKRILSGEVRVNKTETPFIK